jgi:DNA primase
MDMIVGVFERFLGEHKRHNESRCQISFDCPACSDERGLVDGDGKGKLELNYKKGVFRCWVCSYTNDMHGPIERLIKRYGNDSVYKDYKLFKPDSSYDEADDTILQEVIIDLPDGFKRLSDSNEHHYKYTTAYNYLKDRGIGDDIIKDYNIGYTTEGQYKNRIIIPSYNGFGKVNYFIGRAFSKYTKPKYLNPYIEKQLIIFNEDRINWDATIYLVEGVFDHIVVPNSIPLLGKLMYPMLKFYLTTKAKCDIIIVLDDDAEDEAINIYKELDFGVLRGRIKVCKTPYNYDPSLIYQKVGNKGIVSLLRSADKLHEY